MRKLEVFQETERGLNGLMDSVARQCLLTTGTGVGRIFKGGKLAFESRQGPTLST